MAHKRTLTLLILLFLALSTLSVISIQEIRRQYAATLPANITVDFSSRQNTAHPIPSNIFGSNDFIPSNFITQFPSYMQLGGFRVFRRGINLSAVFHDPQSLADPTKRDWHSLNSLELIQASNLQPIFYVVNTPFWLQPNPNPCTQSGSPAVGSVPTSVSTWAQLVKIVVAYIDWTYPNMHPSYEIWNEPDVDNEFCLPGNPSATDSIRVNTYLSLYQAVAPVIKQQATADNVPVKIGGPVIGEYQESEQIINAFMPAFLNDTALSSYIDFVSYHSYFFASDWPSILSITQDGQHGFAAKYKKVVSYVLSGKQHDASSTPIFIDEYNTGATSSEGGCCRNDLIHAPLWNSLVISDILNAVVTNSSSITQFPVPHLDYFENSDSKNHFCLFGVIDVAMDCANTGNMYPYPQFYVYKLINNPQYLDILNNGYLISPPSINLSSITAVGFYTQTKDNLLLVNTSATSYQQLKIAIRHPGNIKLAASLYTLNQQNPHIGFQSMILESIMNGYTTSVDIPAYTTIAVSLDESI